MSSGATPLEPPAPRPTRTLMPTMRSRFSRAMRTHSPRSSRRRSEASPTITVRLKAKMPANETLRNARIRTGDGSMTCRRKPGEIRRPCRARIDEGRRAAAPRNRLGLDADRRAAPVDVRVQIDRAGHHDGAGDLPLLGGLLGNPRQTAATRPPAKPTSRVASRPDAGSITRPPRRIRSIRRFPYRS